MIDLLPVAIAEVARDVFIGGVIFVAVGVGMDRLSRFAYERGRRYFAPYLPSLREREEPAEPPVERVDNWAGFDKAKREHPWRSASVECERRVA